MRNVGSVDRVVRVIVGLSILALFFLLPSPFHWVALVGIVPLVTAAVGFCPLYRLIGVDTTKYDTHESAGCCQ